MDAVQTESGSFSSPPSWRPEGCFETRRSSRKNRGTDADDGRLPVNTIRRQENLKWIKRRSRCRDNNIARVAKYLGKLPQSLKQLAGAHWVSARAGVNLKVDFVNSFGCLD